MATAGLEPKFGVPKHFVVGKGESEYGASKIKDSLVSLAQRTKRLRGRCVAYNMMTTLEIPELLYSTSTDLNVKWGGVQKNLLDISAQSLSITVRSGPRIYSVWDTSLKLRTKIGCWHSLKIRVPSPCSRRLMKNSISWTWSNREESYTSNWCMTF